MQTQPKRDLFGPQWDANDTSVGRDNGKFLGDMARYTADQLRERWKQDHYPELNTTFAKAWLNERG